MITQKSTLQYPSDENGLRKELNALFNEWKESLKDQKLPNRGGYQYTIENFIEDGFFPYYTKQPIRILFVGRESLDIENENYIDELYQAYKTNCENWSNPLDRYSFHNRLFYITYGILNNFPEYHSIAYASEMSRTFATEKGISFSLMNLSKFTNYLQTNADWELINAFVEISRKRGMELYNKNFFDEQISILDPDIIILMNIDYPTDSKLDEIDNDARTNLFTLNIKNKEYYVLNTYHFAARKSTEKDFYNAIRDLCEKHNIIEKIKARKNI